MNCKAYREKLHSYANNELNEIETKSVSEHIDICTACNNELVEIRRLKQVMACVKPEAFQLGAIKDSIMSAVRASKKKAAAYDIKVLKNLGVSMVACGIITLTLNFTGLGNGLIQYTANMTTSLEREGVKLGQPIALINKGLSNMSDSIINLDGVMFRIGEKIRGGM